MDRDQRRNLRRLFRWTFDTALENVTPDEFVSEGFKSQLTLIINKIWQDTIREAEDMIREAAENAEQNHRPF